VRRIARTLPTHADLDVPTAANAGYYAGIVAEKGAAAAVGGGGTGCAVRLRRCRGRDVAECRPRPGEIYDVADRRLSEDFVPLEDLLQPKMDEIDAIASNGGYRARRADRLHRARRGDHGCTRDR